MPDHKKVDFEPVIDAMRHSSEPELQALRDENDSLRQECQELRAEVQSYKDWIDTAVGMLPPSYDADDSPEGIITSFLSDMQTVAGIIAKLTADYR